MEDERDERGIAEESYFRFLTVRFVARCIRLKFNSILELIRSFNAIKYRNRRD
jgi:hypothetical protein